MSMMSVCVHSRVLKLLNTESVAEQYAHSQSREKWPIATSRSVRMQVRPSIHTNSAPAGWSTVKFGIDCNCCYNPTSVACTLRRYQCQYTKLFLWNMLGWKKKTSDKECEEIRKSAIHVKYISLRKSYRLRNNYQKYDAARDIIGCTYTSCDVT